MPEVNITIFSRTYRLAVSSGEEELIRKCAALIDERMTKIRESGKVINQDQVAVLAALELAYENAKKTADQAVQQVEVSNQREAELAHLKSKHDSEVATLKARIAELERAVADTTPAPAPVMNDAALLREIDAISKLCETAIFNNMTKKSLL